MRPRSQGRYSLLATLPLAVMASTFSLARPEAQVSRQASAPSGARYMGSDFCASCHASPANPAFKGSLGHVLLDEFTVWKGYDRHALAYQNLEGKRGRAMGRLLGVDVTKPEGGCLGCHSAIRNGAGAQHPAGDLFRASDGVSCESCHGPSESWIAPHTQHDWRGRAAADKEMLGMVDLRNPARQTALCVSCHVGERDGKVLTHAMFAAGHPPVPTIDVATSGDYLPRHWRLLREKPGADEKGRFERTRLAIVSSSSVLKASMALLAEESRSKQSPIPGAGWPDYARFDCSSCHHELVRPSPRQQRGYEGAPGRPPLARGYSRLVRLAIEELLKEDASHLLGAMDGHEKALREATSSRPFGRLPDLGDAASQYASWAEDVAGRLSNAPLGADRVRTLLRRLVREASETDLEMDAASLVARAAWAFYADLGPDAKSDRKIVEALRALSRDLDLGLPDPPTPPGSRPEARPAVIAQRTGDPARVRESFRKIADSLGPR